MSATTSVAPETAATSAVFLDLAIIGGGPAALSAAIYAARAGQKVTVFERAEIGGALPRIAKLDNYPGFQGSGRDLAKNMRTQAERAGAKIAYGECSGLSKTAETFTLTIDGEPVQSRTVLVATGSEPRPLAPELAQNLQKPVSYCALCDAELAKGKHVVVIGGGNSAFQESLLLAPLVDQLTLVSHSPFRADSCLITQLKSLQNVTLRENFEPTADFLNAFDHIFVFIGQRPSTTFLKNFPEILDSQGYILTSAQETSTSNPDHSTSIPGLFAAGDVRANVLRQVVTAAADGASAAVEIAHFLQ